jgi:hypothetical protein
MVPTSGQIVPLATLLAMRRIKPLGQAAEVARHRGASNAITIAYSDNQKIPKQASFPGWRYLETVVLTSWAGARDNYPLNGLP